MAQELSLASLPRPLRATSARLTRAADLPLKIAGLGMRHGHRRAFRDEELGERPADDGRAPDRPRPVGRGEPLRQDPLEAHATRVHEEQGAVWTICCGNNVRRPLRQPSNDATAASVNLSGSNSPARVSSKILIATSSIRGVEPVSPNRAQACANARFSASRRSSSLNVEFPARLALGGYYGCPRGCECELFHTLLHCTQENRLTLCLTPLAG